MLQAGGLPPLLELMASKNGNLQHNAAFALYGLADNEDNIAAIVREGGVACLQDCELLVQVRAWQIHGAGARFQTRLWSPPGICMVSFHTCSCSSMGSAIQVSVARGFEVAVKYSFLTDCKTRFSCPKRIA